MTCRLLTLSSHDFTPPQRVQRRHSGCMPPPLALCAAFAACAGSGNFDEAFSLFCLLIFTLHLHLFVIAVPPSWSWVLLPLLSDVSLWPPSTPIRYTSQLRSYPNRKPAPTPSVFVSPSGTMSLARFFATCACPTRERLPAAVALIVYLLSVSGCAPCSACRSV